jgi:hypothetical protein
MTMKRNDENSPEPMKKKDDGKTSAPAQEMSLRDQMLNLGFKVRPPSGKGFVIGTGGKPKKRPFRFGLFECRPWSH